MVEQENNRHSPQHPSANIHGMVDADHGETCATRDGKRCSGCCLALQVEEGSFIKEAGDNCEHRIAESGCKLKHEPERPGVCDIYHCSHDRRSLKQDPTRDAFQRLSMANRASFLSGEIDERTYLENLEIHIGPPPDFQFSSDEKDFYNPSMDPDKIAEWLIRNGM